MKLLLDYPFFDERVAEERLKVLKSFGVELVRFVAKGYRGVVFEGKLIGKQVAVKVKRRDIKKDVCQKEYKILKHLEQFCIKNNLENPAPKPIGCGDWFLIEEFIEGKPIKDVRLTKENVKSVLYSCFVLDVAGVKHSELRGGKHIIFQDKRARIIDFESAVLSKKPRNVHQFLGGYIFPENQSILEKIKPYLKAYQENPAENFPLLVETIEKFLL